MKLNLRLKCLSALLPLASYASPLPIERAVAPAPERIRVRLAEALPVVRIRGEGLRFSETGATGARSAHPSNLSPPSNDAKLWELRCQDDRIRAVSQSGDGTRELRGPVRIEANARKGGWILFHDRPYRDAIEIHPVGSLCEVVNHVDLERYLGGLVNSEFSSKWNEESIGAQIVAARTYALHQMRIARGDPDRTFDVDSTTRDQVYDGSMKEDARSQTLVERTRGLVLTAADGAAGAARFTRGPVPLKAFYHSTCGGMTELPGHVWGGAFAGFKRAVRCPYCAGSPVFNWQLELSPQDIAEAFRRAQLSLDLGGIARPEWARGWPSDWRQAVAARQLLEVRAGRWDPEGRVSEVITRWAYTHPRTGARMTTELRLSGARFRDWVGPTKLKSVAFQVIGYGSGAQGKWQFQGRGNGHGVGMCQWGAKTMGERGFKTAAILKFYYPDAALKKMW